MRHKSSVRTLIALGLTALMPAFAHATSLPPLINFQSVLLDEGGNLLPSGPTTVQFQILDENHAAIYSENQTIEVVKGAVAALIGNGSDNKGASTGGIPDDIFAGGAPRYLQVQVTGHAPEDPMTIVPVPYAQWSETCATVSDGGVKTASIAKAAVGFESLAPDVVSKLAAEMSKSQGVVTAQSLNATGGATQVGVEAKFINSGSSTVQGVLQDIDLAVKKRQEETTFLTGKANQEVTDRKEAVKGVQDKLDYETDASKVGSLAQKIDGVGKGLAYEKDVNNPGSLAQKNSELQGQITKILDGTTTSKISPNSIDFSKPIPSELNMDGHKVTKLADPTELTDAATKQYAYQAATNAAQSAPIPVGGIVAGTYIGDGNATQVVALSAQITPRVIFLKASNGGALAEDFALFFSSGLTSHSSWNTNMSEGGVVRWDQGYDHPGICIQSVAIGKLTVDIAANDFGVVYSYIIIGS